MTLAIEHPPQTEERQEWSDWFEKVFLIVSRGQVPVKEDATRGAAGDPGRVIFNTDDGQLNIDDGTNWTLPDGTTT